MPNTTDSSPTLLVGQKVTYTNHAGRPEHAVVESIEGSTVTLKVYGKHENDVYTVSDVGFGVAKQRGTYNLSEPPAKPALSPPQVHPKGLKFIPGA